MNKNNKLLSIDRKIRRVKLEELLALTGKDKIADVTKVMDIEEFIHLSYEI
ncbi:MAG: hypothetical protein RR427_02310 [Cellulosilyticaceae bacterium]